MIRLTGMMTLAVLSLFSAVAAGDEVKVPLDQLPNPVTGAVKKRFPKAELLSASKETENGKTEYEVSIKEAGTRVDVTLTPEGTILGLEKEVAVKDLPKAVTEGIAGKYPKATYKTAEELIRIKEGKEVLEHYEVRLVTVENQEIEVVVTVDGKIVKTEEKNEAKNGKE